MLTLPHLPSAPETLREGLPWPGAPGHRNPGQEEGQEFWGSGHWAVRGESPGRGMGGRCCCAAWWAGSREAATSRLPFWVPATAWPSSPPPGTARVLEPPAPSFLRSWSSCLSPVWVQTACLGPADQWTSPLLGLSSAFSSSLDSGALHWVWGGGPTAGGDCQGGPFALCSHCCFPQGRAPQAQGSGLDGRVGLENRG